MPISSRSWKGSRAMGLPSRWNTWAIMPCGARFGTRPWRMVGKRGKRLWRAQPAALA
jgi:hypothetical protein